MSNADFQARLQRIGATSPQQQPMAQGASPSGRPAKRKLNHTLLAVGAVIMAIGIQAVNHTIEYYHAIRAESGIGTAIGISLVSVLIVLIGCIVAMRALPPKGPTAPATAAASPYSANQRQSVRKASTGGRVFFSLLGFVFGAIACFYLFAAAAARFVDTETAQAIAIGSVLIALLLAFVSLVFGIVGIFLRGYALGRVPVYFLLGVALTFASVRALRINMLEWPQFLTMLQ